MNTYWEEISERPKEGWERQARSRKEERGWIQTLYCLDYQPKDQTYKSSLNPLLNCSRPHVTHISYKFGLGSKFSNYYS